jgi:hypothetical protein
MNNTSQKYQHVNTNGLVAIPFKTNGNGRYVLDAIIVNTKGTSNSAKVYDSTEAIGEDNARLVANIDTSSLIGRINLGIPIRDGIFIRVDGGTAADLTILYSDMT